MLQEEYHVMGAVFKPQIHLPTDRPHLGGITRAVPVSYSMQGSLVVLAGLRLFATWHWLLGYRPPSADTALMRLGSLL
jgi:hypothetical protein